MRHRSRLLPSLLLTAVLLLVGGSTAHAQTPTPSPDPTTPPTATPPPVRAAEYAACGVSYDVIGAWDGGFHSDITVTNTGTVPVTWQVAVVLTSGTFSQGWNADFTDIGNVILAEPPEWSPEIQPGESSFPAGFIGVADPDLHSITVVCSEP